MLIIICVICKSTNITARPAAKIVEETWADFTQIDVRFFKLRLSRGQNCAIRSLGVKEAKIQHYSFSSFNKRIRKKCLTV